MLTFSSWDIFYYYLLHLFSLQCCSSVIFDNENILVYLCGMTTTVQNNFEGCFLNSKLHATYDCTRFMRLVFLFNPKMCQPRTWLFSPRPSRHWLYMINHIHHYSNNIYQPLWITLTLTLTWLSPFRTTELGSELAMFTLKYVLMKKELADPVFCITWV